MAPSYTLKMLTGPTTQNSLAGENTRSVNTLQIIFSGITNTGAQTLHIPMSTLVAFAKGLNLNLWNATNVYGNWESIYGLGGTVQTAGVLGKWNPVSYAASVAIQGMQWSIVANSGNPYLNLSPFNWNNLPSTDSATYNGYMFIDYDPGLSPPNLPAPGPIAYTVTPLTSFAGSLQKQWGAGGKLAPNTFMIDFSGVTTSTPINIPKSFFGGSFYSPNVSNVHGLWINKSGATLNQAPLYGSGCFINGQFGPQIRFSQGSATPVIINTSTSTIDAGASYQGRIFVTVSGIDPATNSLVSNFAPLSAPQSNQLYCRVVSPNMQQTTAFGPNVLNEIVLKQQSNQNYQQYVIQDPVSLLYPPSDMNGFFSICDAGGVFNDPLGTDPNAWYPVGIFNWECVKRLAGSNLNSYAVAFYQPPMLGYFQDSAAANKSFKLAFYPAQTSGSASFTNASNIYIFYSPNI